MLLGESRIRIPVVLEAEILAFHDVRIRALMVAIVFFTVSKRRPFVWCAAMGDVMWDNEG
jgi:hypothetical protein